MFKKIDIDSMSCNHCVRAVEKALTPLSGKVKVVLEDNCAYVEESADDDAIRAAITEADFTVTGISRVDSVNW